MEPVDANQPTLDMALLPVLRCPECGYTERGSNRPLLVLLNNQDPGVLRGCPKCFLTRLDALIGPLPQMLETPDDDTSRED